MRIHTRCRTAQLAVICGGIAALAACTNGGPPELATRPLSPAAAAVMTEAEIANTHANTAYDAIQLSHSTSPPWPNARSTSMVSVSAGLASFAEFLPTPCGKSASSAHSMLAFQESVMPAEPYLSSVRPGGDHETGRPRTGIRSTSL